MRGGWGKDYNYAERLLWQNPHQVLSEIGLKTGATLADIGCGDGFFSLPAAKIMGETGLVYALDANAEAMAAMTIIPAAAKRIWRLKKYRGSEYMRSATMPLAESRVISPMLNKIRASPSNQKSGC